MTSSDLDLRIEDRLPPQNIDAEETILGGILMDSEAITRVVEHLRPEAFYVESHQIIYRAALALHAQGRPTDLRIMTAHLEDNKLIEKVGGRPYLRRLTDAAINTINIDEYARLISAKHALRMLIRAGQEITALGYDSASEIAKLLDRAEQILFAVTQERVQRSLVPASEVLMNIFEQLESRYQDGSNVFGIPTHFYDLDNYTQGLQPSDLLIVAGRPGMGKCCAADTPIVDPLTGDLLTIGEVFRRGATGQPVAVLSLVGDQNLRPVGASDFIDDGIKPLYRVRTRSGREVRTTLTHPYLTEAGWQPLHRLKVGDRIAVPRRIPVFGHQSLPESQILRLAEAVQKAGPATPFSHWQAIFRLPEGQLARFLAHLFAHGGQMCFRTVSKATGHVVQHLLLRFAILSSLSAAQHGYRLEILPEDVQRFVTAIGIQAKRLPVVAGIAERRSATSATTAENPTFLGQQETSATASGDIWWDAIVSIEYTGNEQVYDLTVPGSHNFVAADICLHNTAFSLTIAQKIAQKVGLPAVVFSLEMSKEQLVQRLLCAEAGVESHRLRAARISENEWQRIGQAIGELASIPLYIDDSPNATVTEIRSKARRLQAEQGGRLGLVMIDYLQLMEGAGSDNRVQELSKITRGLKGLARELRVPVMALSQLSRSVEARTNKRPMLSDLRESGSIEQDADIVMMLYRDDYYNPDSPDRNIAEVNIVKHRNGPTGTVKLLFENQFTRFLNLNSGGH
ncbi:replicative DNA helicase [Gloeobacter kilaueensis]|uniref:Replicative DNA helicase n=1 Tax=Gloeobacter kilaueensis (strain ATCC BAA-2537 / CCAP 1431/1 / ULC 316 / JS1) TaxID=1183438 RepID=U5QPW2_GLOK1|nr:replicative DNA helicase [Gloeobacter kilaueensis]AGY59669.1 replicative DNA helicase [Gloeobacter kilaueensis JS1]